MPLTRLVVPLMLLLLAVAAAALQLKLGFLHLPFLDREPALETAAPPANPAPRSLAGTPTRGKPEQHDSAAGPAMRPDFDVARIDPNGVSVFAGRAAPRTWVTVLADGTPVGAVESDANGEWSLATDKKLPASPTLSITTGPKPPAPDPKASAAAASDATSVSRQVVANLEALVAAAREGLKTAPPPPEAPASRATAMPPAAAGGILAPVPILFHYREARFTDDGARAAGLLLEYLRLKHIEAITLTGHADERGDDEPNIELSRQRLDAVERFLRHGGYDGKLTLVAEGKRQPFAGVDRSKYPQDVLWQLDRRVELSTVTR